MYHGKDDEEEKKTPCIIAPLRVHKWCIEMVGLHSIENKSEICGMPEAHNTSVEKESNGEPIFPLRKIIYYWENVQALLRLSLQ